MEDTWSNQSSIYFRARHNPLDIHLQKHLQCKHPDQLVMFFIHAVLTEPWPFENTPAELVEPQPLHQVGRARRARSDSDHLDHFA